MSHGRIQALIDPRIERVFDETIQARSSATEKITKRQALEEALLAWVTASRPNTKRLATLARAKIETDQEAN